MTKTLKCLRCKCSRAFDVENAEVTHVYKACQAPRKDGGGSTYASCGGTVFGTEEWIHPVRWSLRYGDTVIVSQWLEESYDKAVVLCKDFLENNHGTRLQQLYGEHVVEFVTPCRVIARRMADGRVNGDRLRIIEDGISFRLADGGFMYTADVQAYLENREQNKENPHD